VALQGKKIQAIKYYRALHNAGLKEAKEAVEDMIA
jgi:ribosomal protein L7/L12